MTRTRARLPALQAHPEPTSPPDLLRDGAETVTVTATEAQNEFGRVFENAIRDQIVVITRHSVPRAVLVSVERYRELVSAESSILNTLTDEFDAMLARMQVPEVSSGTARGFQATPVAMGQAAEAAARKSRRGA